MSRPTNNTLHCISVIVTVYVGNLAVNLAWNKVILRKLCKENANWNGVIHFLHMVKLKKMHPLWVIHLVMEKKTISMQHYNEEQFFCGKQFWVIIMLYDQARIVWFLERWAPPLPLAVTNLHLLHCLVNQMLLSHRRSQTLIPCPPSSLLFNSFWPSVNQRGRDVTAKMPSVKGICRF